LGFYGGISMADDSNKRPGSIEEALRVLDEALARPAADLKEMIGQDFGNLRSAFGETFARSVESATTSFSNLKDSARSTGKDTAGRIGEFSSEAISNLMENGREAAQALDKNIRANPWPMIGGIAAGTFALGFLLAKGSKVQGGTLVTAEITKERI
jgi:ElaB/YqjD/DUF883 family membrane-anchored ribosome-binding protein